MDSFSIILVLGFLTLSPARQGAKSQPIQVTEKSDFDVSELSLNSIYEKRFDFIFSKDNKYSATVALLIDPEYNDKRDNLILHDITTNKFFRFRNPGLSHRLIDNLMWISSTSLQLDIWASPHFGHRYTINAKTHKVVAHQFLRD